MQRRGFLQAVGAFVHGVTAVLLAVPAVRFLLSPLSGARKRSTEMIRVAPLDVLVEEQPFRAVVKTDRRDAYIHYPPGPVGSVWLLRSGEPDAEPKVRCLQVICPHLGCGIDFAGDRDAFYCPCHASEFGINGQRRFGPSPRAMDELSCRVTEPDADGRRWVEIAYLEFQTGSAQKRPLA